MSASISINKNSVYLKRLHSFILIYIGVDILTPLIIKTYASHLNKLIFYFTLFFNLKILLYYYKHYQIYIIYCSHCQQNFFYLLYKIKIVSCMMSCYVNPTYLYRCFLKNPSIWFAKLHHFEKKKTALLDKKKKEKKTWKWFPNTNLITKSPELKSKKRWCLNERQCLKTWPCLSVCIYSITLPIMYYFIFLHTLL